MTHEEMERTMEFIAQTQARITESFERSRYEILKLDEGQARVHEAIVALTGMVGRVEGTVGRVEATVERVVETVGRVDEDAKARAAKMERAFARLADAQTQTEESLKALIVVVKGHIGEHDRN